MATDPVCGMFVATGPKELKLVRDNRAYYFCSETCLRTFDEPDRERRRLLYRLAVAWPLAIVVVVLTYGPQSTSTGVIAATLAAAVQFYSGSVFYRGTYDALRNRVANMDVLIAVGTTAAFLYSVAVLVLPGRLPSAYYFDASALIVTLILTGNYLEHLARGRAGSALRRLSEVLPPLAEVVRGGTAVQVPLSEVRLGDLVRVRPGGRFPADGVVRIGSTTADESLLTGESLPVLKSPGARVLAGSINGPGVVDVEATGVGTDTFLATVGRLLTDAEMSRVPLQRTADRIAAIFVPLVLLLAVTASLGWYLIGGATFTTALLVFVTVSITACPCAFGIATPAAILVGTGRAAEEGILFRGEDAIEQTSRVDLLLTDKTGTLTTNIPTVAAVQPVPSWSMDDVLSLAAGIELGSEHVLARAVLAEAARCGVSPTGVTEVRTDPGRGISGMRNGTPVAVLRGSEARARDVRLDLLADQVRAAEVAGEAWSVVVSGETAVGLIKFRNTLAPGVARAIEELRAEGVDVAIATGDHVAAATSVARNIGITKVHAEATPEQKVSLVEQYRREGHRVAFVGDGINDAAALAAADVGLAIGTGTDVAREAGQVLLVRSNFAGVPAAIRLARRIVRRVRWNLTWAIGYNLVLLPVAAGALVPLWGFSIYAVLPIVGALAMGLSSTTVVLNSLSLRRVGLTPGESRRDAKLRTERSVATG
jgi:P-type Cu+ transporter